MINTRYDLFTHSKQISLVLNHYIFIVSEAQFSLDGKGHDIESLALGFSRSPTQSHRSVKTASERCDFNQIGQSINNTKLRLNLLRISLRKSEIGP